MLLLSIARLAYGQEDSGNVQALTDVSAKYAGAVGKRAGDLEGKLDKKSEKALQQYEKQAAKLKSKLAKVDPAAATRIFGDADKQYRQLTDKLKQPTQKLQKYIPGLDTMGTSLKFIDQYKDKVKNVKELQTAMTKVDALKSQFQKAEDIKAFLKQQKQYLKDNLEKFGTDSYRYADVV